MRNLSPFDDPHAAVQELMRRDFGSFLIRAMPHIQGGADLDYNWHIDAIAYQLERVRNGACRRLIVNLPPRNLKSIMISVAWVAWRLGNDPKLNFVCVSYSNELSAKHARDCRSIMQSRWYHDLFPGTRINGSRSAAHDFETTAGGGRLATSIGGTLTGRGGDIIIIDDPIKPDDANSDTARDAVNEWFHSTLASRLSKFQSSEDARLRLGDDLGRHQARCPCCPAGDDEPRRGRDHISAYRGISRRGRTGAGLAPGLKQSAGPGDSQLP